MVNMISKKVFSVFLGICLLLVAVPQPFDTEASTLNSVSAQILSFAAAVGTFYPTNNVASSCSIKNTGTERWTFWLGYSVQDAAGRWFDIPSISVTLDKNKTSNKLIMTWNVPSDPLLTTGLYKVTMAVWKTRPENGGATKLTSVEKANSFTAYYFLEHFNSFDGTRWSKENHGLGRGQMNPNNIGVSSSNLSMKCPKGTFDGAEIRSNVRYLYGTYSARIKCPSLPNTLTTIFLYQGVSGGNDEIDIEIYNDGSRKVDFVTWVGGTKTNIYQCSISFDPSAGYHTYQIDFYPNSVKFYIDGLLKKPFSSNLPSHPMYLMANTWSPTWLTNPPPKPPTVDKYAYYDIIIV